MINNIIPTSKIALKQQCLLASRGDLDLATKMYDYFSKDIEDLPTFDVVRPSAFQQIKEGAVQTVSWLNQNQDQVLNWVGFIKEMFGRGQGTIPPIQTQSAPIPSINK